jgi:hypothetical protein
MSQPEGSNINIEKTKDRVILKVNGLELQMSATLARQLGDQLYKCGCDVAQTEKR